MSRGFLAQRLGEVEGGGEGEVAELDSGRVLEGDGLDLDPECALHGLADRGGESLLRLQDHSR